MWWCGGQGGRGSFSRSYYSWRIFKYLMTTSPLLYSSAILLHGIPWRGPTLFGLYSSGRGGGISHRLTWGRWSGGWVGTFSSPLPLSTFSPPRTGQYQGQGSTKDRTVSAFASHPPTRPVHGYIGNPPPALCMVAFLPPPIPPRSVGIFSSPFMRMGTSPPSHRGCPTRPLKCLPATVLVKFYNCR